MEGVGGTFGLRHPLNILYGACYSLRGGQSFVYKKARAIGARDENIPQIPSSIGEGGVPLYQKLRSVPILFSTTIVEPSNFPSLSLSLHLRTHLYIHTFYFHFQSRCYWWELIPLCERERVSDYCHRPNQLIDLS